MKPMDKKGQIIGLSLAGVSIGVIIVIVIGILLLIFGLGWFVSVNKWMIIGVLGLIFTFIYAVPAALRGDLTKNKLLFLGVLFLMFIGIMFVPTVLQTSFTGTNGQAVEISTHSETPLTFCSTVADCTTQLKAKGMPDTFLSDNKLQIDCSNGCKIKKA